MKHCSIRSATGCGGHLCCYSRNTLKASQQLRYIVLRGIVIYKSRADLAAAYLLLSSCISSRRWRAILGETSPYEQFRMSYTIFSLIFALYCLDTPDLKLSQLIWPAARGRLLYSLINEIKLPVWLTCHVYFSSGRWYICACVRIYNDDVHNSLQISWAVSLQHYDNTTSPLLR